MTTKDFAGPTEFQIAIWGYALWGTGVLEVSALVSERVSTDDAFGRHEWDRDYALLCATTELWVKNERQEIPYRWALPWVMEASLPPGSVLYAVLE